MSVAATIDRIHAREVLDSRGQPTVEVDVVCRGGAKGRAIVPAGASTGRHEARELRDGEPQRFAGKGVRRAVAHVNEQIAPRLAGLPVHEQARIDQLLCELDGTVDKSRLGANAILGVSLACAHAAAAACGQALWHYLADRLAAGVGGGLGPRLPLPMVNLISGGLHAGGNLDLQDFLLLPIGASSYSQALEMTANVCRTLGRVLLDHGFEGVLVGDEGGFGPRLERNEQALELIVEAFARAGYVPGQEVAIALDVASTHFHRAGCYHLKVGERPRSAAEMVDLLADWVEKYPILSIEDGLAEDDWPGWRVLTQTLGGRVQLVGDDLFATNLQRLARGIQEQVANSVLIKPNQAGTLTETVAAMNQARAAGYRTIVSARSGETEDTTIADLAVATAAGQIKIGSLARSERLAKYNQLLRIEEELGGAAFSRWQPLSSPAAPVAGRV
jgi:enolase